MEGLKERRIEGSTYPTFNPSILISLKPYHMSEIKVGQKAPDFKLVGTDMSPISLANYKGKNLILHFFPLAFTSVCTHTGCARAWAFSNDVARCTCHGSEFDNRGRVVTGPASRALAEFSVAQDGNTVTIR